ncbi:histidinol-phosphate transaminase [[Clostridium] fimetarium]|uniref:Histidinol-phosphate aminotransferase n=1 Tax=[Clostridium] fimetarium TaxID=99656 RepID=A0A1I0R2B3_9FIRM|nr:histidinol-phosphate transaminase [[Clostridium] fimetarium]SEW34459.1 histidinol-phosphate aminotransferase [[Clostridium] fimetarium]
MNAWEKNIRKVVPYVPGEQPKEDGIIKLNTNENPYPPTPKATQVAAEFDMDTLKLYPDPDAFALVNVLADYYGLNSDQVYVGVGSDDVIAMAFMTYFNSDKPILFPDISYSFYSVWADLYKIPYERPSLDDNFNIIASDYYKENGGVIFPNPNAPTAVYTTLDIVEDIIKHNQDVVVIVDEAYIDFGGKSALELIEKYDNLLVVQTFSKSRSMAGMRIGYAMGNKALIKALNDVKFSFNSYTMNATSLVYGVEAVKDDEYFKTCIDKIVKTREVAKKRLTELGFTFTDSKANFIFATHKSVKAKDIFEKLKDEHIYVRYFNLPRIDNYLRITVGTDEEMGKLVEALREIVEE